LNRPARQEGHNCVSEESVFANKLGFTGVLESTDFFLWGWMEFGNIFFSLFFRKLTDKNFSLKQFLFKLLKFLTH